MTPTESEENPFAVTTNTTETVELAPLQFGLGFWVCLLVFAIPVFALIPSNIFLSILGGQVLAFTVIRSVVYLKRAREFRHRMDRLPVAYSGVALFMLSLIVASLSSIASWICFVAVCTPLGLVGIVLVNASRVQNNSESYFFFGLFGVSALVALFAQWILIRMTLPTTFEVHSTYSNTPPPQAPPVLGESDVRPQREEA